MAASKETYLALLADELAKRWPDNRAVNIVCHGHSVPCGYACTPLVRPLDAYPHLLRCALSERYPYAVVNVIVTGIGGENSEQGARRFEREVLVHRPTLLTIDYALNDRSIGLAAAEAAWRFMIECTRAKDIPVLLLTPSWDVNGSADEELRLHAAQIRRLADEYDIGLVDSYAAYAHAVERGEALNNLLSHINHPSRRGHELIARELAAWFPPR